MRRKKGGSGGADALWCTIHDGIPCVTTMLRVDGRCLLSTRSSHPRDLSTCLSFSLCGCFGHRYVLSSCLPASSICIPGVTYVGKGRTNKKPWKVRKGSWGIGDTPPIFILLLLLKCYSCSGCKGDSSILFYGRQIRVSSRATGVA